MDDRKKHARSRLIGHFALSFVIVFTLSFFILFLLELKVRSTKMEELKLHEARVVRLQNEYLGREFNLILSDLYYLCHAYEERLIGQADYTVLVHNWAEFSTHRQVYDQISYLDLQGDEKIVIKMSAEGAFPMPAQSLRNQKEQGFFKESIRLQKEEVYVSPLDLNLERHRREGAYRPMLQISTPVYDGAGRLQGVLVLSYHASSALKEFRELSRNSQGEIMLLNGTGYWLSSQNPSNDWNAMFLEGKEVNFQSIYPEEWEEIIKGEGQVITGQGLFTFTPVNIVENFQMEPDQSQEAKVFLGGGDWYIVSLIKREEKSGYFTDEIGPLISNVVQKNASYFLLIAVISGVAGVLVSWNRKTYVTIKYFSEYDHLTKAYNRRAGLEKLHDRLSGGEQKQPKVSLCFLDINGLKEVNDTLGHQLGDELIQAVSQEIRRSLRPDDFLIRLGGDEFLIVFYGLSIEESEEVWQEIAASYEGINAREGRPYLISVSHGIIQCNLVQKTQVDELIHAADEKMYEEKQRVKQSLQVIRS